MDIAPVDPRDTEWETGPIFDYRVIFWSGRGESSEYDVLGADDVRAVMTWADAEAGSRGSTYALYAKVRDGLVWIAGVDPTAMSRANFVRRHPLG